MKVIIAGSRNFSNYAQLKAVIAICGFEITEVVSGGAQGADYLGERYADEHGIPIKRFPADWKRYGLSAGPMRNKDMADYGEALIALPMGASRGTRNMIMEAKKRKLKTFIVES